ncbi:Eco57I restriction-modification methylase domain-containing protein, partial [Chloroflexota bacterium]
MEIARLNLLLRSLARRETLPSLADNIRRGNSLISGGEAELRPYFGDSWTERRPFNWDQAFPSIMKKGGFDIVVGNPPYVRIQMLPRDEAEYYRNHYDTAFGSFDIYILFIERAIRLLNPGGRLGLIISSKFLKSQYGTRVLEMIRREGTVETIVDLSAQTVFAEATTYPAILIMKKGSGDVPLHYIPVPEKVTDSHATSAMEIESLPSVIADQGALTKRIWPPLATGDTLWQKLTANAEPLGESAGRIFQGLITSADRVYILEKLGDTGQGLVRVRSRETGKIHELESEVLRPLLSGQDIKRYSTPDPKNLLLFPYRVCSGGAKLISISEFANEHPRCWQYLLQNRSTLEGRERNKMCHEEWYAYVYPKNLALHDLPKFAIPRLVKHLEAVYDNSGSFYLDNVDVGGIILKDGAEENYLYVLGLLHSRLIDFCFRRLSAPFRGDFRSANRQFIEPLPIRRIDFSDPTDQETHNDIVTLVQRMLHLHRELHQTPPEHTEARREVEREIEHTNQAIDTIVYDLYGLKREEKEIIVTS